MLDGTIKGVDRAAAEAFLKEHAPWRMKIDFDCGLSSADFETYEPFNPRPLFKLEHVLPKIPSFPNGGRVLDIGANRGHNAIFLAQKYAAKVTAIDAIKRHQSAALALAQLADVQLEYLIEDAEHFCRKETFDLVLHLGTLYHLANPIASMKASINSVAPGGYFALETMQLVDEDKSLCKWIYGLSGDDSNHWALGDLAIVETMKKYGLDNIEKLREGFPPRHKGRLSRSIWVAQKV